jgi:hypothetical protein
MAYAKSQKYQRHSSLYRETPWTTERELNKTNQRLERGTIIQLTIHTEENSQNNTITEKA